MKNADELREQKEQKADIKIRRKINKKIMAEIKKHVHDENQQKHLIFLIEESLAKPLSSSDINIRNPSSWIKSLSSNFTWTNRELEWYFAEDRFLFAALNEEDCDKWVCIINWLIAQQEEEMGVEFKVADDLLGAESDDDLGATNEKIVSVNNGGVVAVEGHGR